VTRNLPVDLPADAPSLVRELQLAGWHTALVGKTHWTNHERACDLRENATLLRALGFNSALEIAGPRALQRLSCSLTDAWSDAGVLHTQRADLAARYSAGLSESAWQVRPSVLPTPLYPDIWIAERGLEALATMPQHKPWLLWVSFVGPHEPFDTPVPWHGGNRLSKLPNPQATPAWLSALPEDSELRQGQQRWLGRLSEKAVRACRADYADHLQLLDQQLGRLLDALATRSDQRRTGVAVTADHGELLGDCGMLYKGNFLEGAVRVPWIYAPPTDQTKATLAGARTTAPLPLTGLIEQTLKNLPRGGDSRWLQRWSRQEPGAVVEFGSELLLIQGQRKLVLDQEGEVQWAIDLARDPLEQKNVMRANPQRWRWSPGWRRLRRWGQREWQRRSAAGWRWRHLPLDSPEPQG
jgi:choline-sulfatase